MPVLVLTIQPSFKTAKSCGSLSMISHILHIAIAKGRPSATFTCFSSSVMSWLFSMKYYCKRLSNALMINRMFAHRQH